MLEEVTSGDHVLVVWSDLGPDPQTLQDSVNIMKTAVGSSGSVSVENYERVTMGGHKPATFSKIISGLVGMASVTHSSDIFTHFLKILAPNGSLYIAEKRAAADLGPVRSNLVLSGFTNIRDPLPSEDGVYSWACGKPQFEVGASKLLSFAKKPEPKKAAMWTLDDMEDDTVELIDENTLLEEADLVKPDPASLRVCGTTGKRKACKDCSCGLAEELADGKEVKTKSVTSSCGSCYLGDAFRCGSCPYLGMPAFKPGQKIQLSDRQLNPDLRA